MTEEKKLTMNIYIDSNNFYKNACTTLNIDKVKFKWADLILGIRDLIQEDYNCRLSKAIYYSALSDRNDNPKLYSAQKRFLDAISHVPFIETHIGRLSKIPRTPGKPIIPNDPTTYKHIEKNTDINISNDMLQHMYTNSTDVFVLCSADGDFADTINKIKEFNKTILVVTTVGAKSITVRNAVGDQNIYYLDQKFLSKFII